MSKVSKKRTLKYVKLINGETGTAPQMQEANLSPGLVSASSNQGSFGSGRAPDCRAWFSSLERSGSPTPPGARSHQVEPTTTPVDAFSATTLAPTASSTEASRERDTASKKAADHNSVDIPAGIGLRWNRVLRISVGCRRWHESDAWLRGAGSLKPRDANYLKSVKCRESLNRGRRFYELIIQPLFRRKF